MKNLITILFILASIHCYAGKDWGTETITQYRGPMLADATNQVLLRIALTVVNGGGTAAISGMNFTVSGSSECANAKLYYTGTSSTFASTDQLGSTVTDLSGAVEFDFTEKDYATASGPYYFWLTVDIKSSGSLTEGTVVDAQWTGADNSGNANAPTPTDPSGFRITGTTYEVGSGGTFDHFATLGDAVTDINSSTYEIDGSITDIYYELVSSTTETGAITITYSNATTDITFRPATGEVGLTTEPTTSTTLGSSVDFITFSGAQNVNFDGRPGGVGSVIGDSDWIIRNTRTAVTGGTVFTYISDATYCNLSYLTIESETDAGGIIEFLTASSGGNDNNTIEYCSIQDLTSGGSADFPDFGIFSEGSASNENSSVTIDNCHFVDISEEVNTNLTGLLMINTNTDAWTITNNHFYHNAATTLPEMNFGFYCFIYINTGGGYTITGNYMGGTSASCGGTAFTGVGTSTTSGSFRGVQLQSLSGGAITLSNNTVANLDLTFNRNTGAGNAIFCAFRLDGTADITCGSSGNGNTIGSQSSTGSILITQNNASALGGIVPIWDGSTGTTSSAYNTIGGITIQAGGTASNTLNSMIRLYSTGATSKTVDNNIIGGTVANSIDIADDMEFHAIHSQQVNGATITNNTIQNIRQQGADEFYGIWNTDGALTCTGNTIKDITHSTNFKTFLIAHGGESDPSSNTLVEDATITSNVIQDITLSNTGTTSQMSSILINSSGTINCSTNTIGSTSVDNISVANDQSNYAVYILGNGTITCDDNTVQEWTLTNTGTGNAYGGIWVADGTVSSMDGNTVKNIMLAGEAIHTLIGVSTGDNASVTNNDINNIEMTGSGASQLYALYVGTSGTIVCSNNSLSDITGTGASTAETRLLWVNGSNASITVSSNTIGSATNQNIAFDNTETVVGLYFSGAGTPTISGNTIQEIYKSATSTATANDLNGIEIASTAGAVTISGNTIKELETLSQEGGTGLRGIAFDGGNASQSTITGNNISLLKNSSVAAVNSGINGISHTGANVKIEKNLIQQITTTATGTSKIRGIYMDDDAAVENNVILLSNESNTNDVIIYGISDALTTSETATVYHNTIAISGSTSSGTPNSYVYYNANPGTSTIKLNLFQNTRSGSGTHYIYYISDGTNLTMDYNYLESSDQIGNWEAGGDQSTLANWRTASSQEANSVTGTETLDANGKASSSFAGDDAGLDLSGTVSDDKEGTARPATPRMGAFEGNNTLPVELIAFQGTCHGDYMSFDWSTASEENNDYFTLYHSEDGHHFNPLHQVYGGGNSNVILTYHWDAYDIQSGYFKLVQTDYDGQFEEVGLTHVGCASAVSNPLVYKVDRESGMIELQLSNIVGPVKVSVVDIAGRTLFYGQYESVETANQERIYLPKQNGVYLINLFSPNSSYSNKFNL